MAVLAQLMVVWVQRRRRDIAVLKTMGFVRRQVLALVAWQAGTFAALALLIGIPLGILAGRSAWALFAGELGIGSSSVVPGIRIALCVPAVLLIALMVAIGPAAVASRVRAGQGLPVRMTGRRVVDLFRCRSGGSQDLGPLGKSHAKMPP